MGQVSIQNKWIQMHDLIEEIIPGTKNIIAFTNWKIVLVCNVRVFSAKKPLSLSVKRGFL